MAKKKTAAQLEREIKDVLSRKVVSSTDPSVQWTASELAEAAYAIFERPGGEDLTRDEFYEEVRGLLRPDDRWIRGSTDTDRLNRYLDTLYKRIYGEHPALVRPARSAVPPKMQAALALAARNGGKVGTGAYGARAERVAPATIRALIARGLLTPTYGSEGEMAGELTAAGRALVR